MGLRLGRHQKWGWVKQHLERNITGKKIMYLKQKNTLRETSQEGRLLLFIKIFWIGVLTSVLKLICTLYCTLAHFFLIEIHRLTNFLKIPRYYNQPFLANFPFSWSWQTPPVKKAKEWLTWTVTEKRPRWLNEDTISMKLNKQKLKLTIRAIRANFLWSLGVDGWHA